MPNPKSIKRRRPASHYIRYDDETKAKIQRFLAACLIDARRMVGRIKELAIADRWQEMTTNQYQYWCNVESALRALIHRSGLRQRHLYEIDDATIAEVIKSCRPR